MTPTQDHPADDEAADRAVVIGGSIAGLLAARVLSETFPHVTVIDRDVMPAEPEHRKSVPHGRHTHGLLAKGFEIFEGLLPGFGEDLLARGALVSDLQNSIVWYNEGHLLRRAPSDMAGLLASRPLIESHVRRRVAALRQVEIRSGVHALGLTVDADQITGVRTDAGVLPARLVVDATGRGNRGPAWLAEIGYPAPPQDVVKCDLIYCSREYRRVPGAQDFLGVLVGRHPGNPYGAGSLATEGGRWLVTLVGAGDDPPPVQPGAFEEYAARLDGPELHQMITTAEPLGDPFRIRIGPSVRRRYERCERLPEGFVAVGDALCCVNPVYGQGMTTAAMAARWLGACLRSGPADLTRRYFRGAARVVDAAWDISVGADLRFPQVAGARTRRGRALNSYLSRLHRVAAVDPVVGAGFLKVANLLAGPQHLMSPTMLRRVLRKVGNPAEIALVRSSASLSIGEHAVRVGGETQGRRAL
ncbi:FAD-binding monooxygenase [Streptosporangiaceae bacterium NEAU-GS5]|nr:FAD-binding monooxygenase [Streptosporangiaceae bacterium NEAU-GS5]